MGFGERIRLARNAKALTGETLGRKLGVTKATISKWETEDTEPSVDQIKALCTVLECTPDWLFEWKRDDLPPDAMNEAKAFARLSAEDRRRWKALRKAMFSAVE